MVVSNRALVFETNNVGRDFIVGDIHGHFEYLVRLCEHVNFVPKNGDRLFCTGNLINKGPDSLRSLAIIQNPWCFSVIGSHEQIVVGIASDDIATRLHNSTNHLLNGGKWMVELADKANVKVHEIAKQIVEQYISKMPYIIVVGKGKARFNIVHAEIYGPNHLMSDWDIDNWTFTPEEIRNMVWGRAIIRNPVGSDSYHPMQHALSRTYVGHTPVDVVLTHEYQTYIDTGAAIASEKHPDRGLTIVDHAAQKYWTYRPTSNSIVEYTVPPLWGT